MNQTEDANGRATALIRNEDEGERLWFAGGGVFTMKATTGETGGALMLFEDHVVRGKATPLHLHPDNDELVYVLDGEILVHIADAKHRVGPGGLFFAPRGVAHAFQVRSEAARLLCLQTPGSSEAFYRSVSTPATSPDDVARPPDLQRLREGAQRSPSIKLLGPPPFNSP